MERDEKRSATAVVKVCVSEAGAVSSSTIIKPSGYPAFDARVASSVRTWRYKPYAVDGKTVPVCSAVAVTFTR